jgi:hypothetical protein
MAGDVKKESLGSEVDHAIEESRMVLPGIQALFGFQLIAVFSQRFEQLPVAAQRIHLSALILVVVAIALIMAPAAYHRQVERGTVSRHFADYASRMITIAMVPLMIAISMDVAVATLLVLADLAWSAFIGGVLLCVFLTLWFVVPYATKRTRRKRVSPGAAH